MTATDETRDIVQLASGVYRIEGAEVYAVASDSTKRMHQVTLRFIDGELDSGRCDGPHCHQRVCKHIRKTLEALKEEEKA